MQNKIAFLILGFAIGIAAYRIFMEYVCGTTNLIMCDLCQYRWKKLKHKKMRELSRKK